MNDFKTSECKPLHTGDSATSLSDLVVKPVKLIIVCNGVTFSLKELNVDIALDEGQLKKYLDNIDALTINGMKFVKVGPEKR